MMNQFVRADTTNLPRVCNVMILEYMSSTDKHNIAEIRGAKVLMSSRDSYIDTAVGYVEVQRTSGQCIVRAKVVPEHKVSQKHYAVTISVDETNETITETACDGCAASAGGCKHTLVMLFWLEKRSSEPAPTSIQCYWKKPSLSGIRSDPISSEDIFNKSKKIKLSPKDTLVKENFLKECKRRDIKNSLVTCFDNPKISYNIFDMSINYLIQLPDQTSESFPSYLNYLNGIITPAVIDEINAKTIGQVNSKLWHTVRQGRITASKIYESTRCSTDGTLVQQILGGYKVPETIAIKRGKRLEKEVLKEVENIIKKEINPSGFILVNGIMGASPDGVGDDFIVEVKCPMSTNTTKSYIFEDGRINPRYTAQMQMQMYAAKKKKGIFCVADPQFEQNKIVSTYCIEYDDEEVVQLINKGTSFWEQYIFKKIISSAKVQA